MTTEAVLPDLTGHFGKFGGRFVPEALMAALDEITDAFGKAKVDPVFQAQLHDLQVNYTGRPSPLTVASRFSQHAGGATILLIVAALGDSQLEDLNELAKDLGLSVLVEVHNEDELERAFELNPLLLGVNARNLKTLEVDLAVCQRLIPMIPKNILAIAESGISSLKEVEQLVQAGARGVLVGETLVKSGNPSETIQEWTEVGTQIAAQVLGNRS